jgi:hypothetical protein
MVGQLDQGLSKLPGLRGGDERGVGEEDDHLADDDSCA